MLLIACVVKERSSTKVTKGRRKRGLNMREWFGLELLLCTCDNSFSLANAFSIILGCKLTFYFGPYWLTWAIVGDDNRVDFTGE